MSSKFKFNDKEAVYFVAATVVDWIDVFTRNIYRDILLDSFRFCQLHQGLQMHAWVLMPNHFHLICSFINNADPGKVIKNIKSFTAIKLIDAIINNSKESRKHWILDLLQQHGKANKSNKRFQFWQHENYPVLLGNEEMYRQRFDYLHENPVKAGFVTEPQYWYMEVGWIIIPKKERGCWIWLGWIRLSLRDWGEQVCRPAPVTGEGIIIPGRVRGWWIWLDYIRLRDWDWKAQVWRPAPVPKSAATKSSGQ